MQDQIQKQKNILYKDGQILKRSNILKSWNERRILLKYKQQILEILTKNTNRPKIIQLSQYKAKWVDKIQDKQYHCFQLIANNQKDNKLKYKSIMFGTKDKNDTLIWFNEIDNIINKKYEQNNTKNDQKTNNLSQKLKSNHQINTNSNQNNDNTNNTNSNTKINQQITNNTQQKNNFTKNVEDDKTTDNSLHIKSKINHNFNILSSEGQQNSPIQSEEDYLETGDRQERNKNEFRKMPYFSSYCKNSQMPVEIKNQDNQKIQQIVENSPIFFKSQVQKLLLQHQKQKGSEIWAKTRDTFEIYEQSNNQNMIYKHKNKINKYRGIIKCKNSPMYLYEETNIPTTQQHWHPQISFFDIKRAQQEKCDLIKINFVFKRKSLKKPLEKVVFYHRYGFYFQDAYFLISRTLGSDYTDESYEHFLSCTQKFYKTHDENNQLQNIMATDISLQFNEESGEDIKLNTLQYLQSLQEVEHEPVTQNQDKYILDFQNFGKIEEDLSFVNSNKDEKQNSDNNDNFNDNENEIGSFAIGCHKKSEKGNNFSEAFTLGNADKQEEEEQILQLLKNIDDNIPTLNCIANYHELKSLQQEIEQRIQTTDKDGHFCWKNDYIYDEKQGGIVFVNEKLKQAQKNVLIAIMKRVGSNLMSGKSIMSVSMPVTIFENKSFLQRMARSFGNAPHFLGKAAEHNDDVIEQIKYCAAFAISSFTLQCSQLKPFNPILGETSQARINGHPIYFEQVSHHPPISTYLHYGPGYILSGSHSPEINMQANSLEGFQRAHPVVTFKYNNRKIYIIWGSFQLQGTVFGTRIMNASGITYVFEPESRNVLEIVHNPKDKGALTNFFSKNKKSMDDVQGVIYKVKQDFINQLLEAHKPYSKNQKTLKINPNQDIESYLSNMSGKWHKQIFFDDEKYWEIDQDIPYQLDYEKNQLPSDSQFRKDLLYLSLNNINKSQDEKEQGEIQQRKDEKLRKKFQNQQKKIKK